MWIKLGSEQLNLDHVVRIRFNVGWKHGKEEVVAELESFAKGELAIFARYRGVEADQLRAAFRDGAVPATVERVPAGVPAAPELANPIALSQSATNTLHDM